MLEIMKNGTISFSPDYRESKFELYVVQLAIGFRVYQGNPGRPSSGQTP